MGCSVSTIDMKSSKELSIDRNSFVVGKVIGEGGFGKVTAEVCLKDEKWCAVKTIIKAELLKHKTGMTMILGELNALKVVDHPFAVKLNYAYHDPMNCYFAFDLKVGGDLRFYLRQRHSFDEKFICFVVACVTSALQYLHEQRIIHRDVKPENVILDAHGWPHLTDFGVAYVGDLNERGPLQCTLASGTKQYLAPEVFSKSHKHGPEADFWSLGVMMFELLYFRRPFDKHVPVSYINFVEECEVMRESHPQVDMESSAQCVGTPVSNSSTPVPKFPEIPDVRIGSFVSSAAVSSYNGSLLSGTMGSPTGNTGSFSPVVVRSGSRNGRQKSIQFSPLTLSRRSVKLDKLQIEVPLQENMLKPPLDVDKTFTGDDEELINICNAAMKVRVSEDRPPDHPFSSRDRKLDEVLYVNVPSSPQYCRTPGNTPSPSFAHLRPTSRPTTPGTKKETRNSPRCIDASFSPVAQKRNLTPLYPELGKAGGIAEPLQQQRETGDKKKAYSSDLRSDLYSCYLPYQGLPRCLRVPIPLYNSQLARVSPSCIAMIEGLLDPRPFYRIGAGSLLQVEKMRNHSFFQHYQYDIHSLELKKMSADAMSGKALQSYPPFDPIAWFELSYHNLNHDELCGGPVVDLPALSKCELNSLKRRLTRSIGSKVEPVGEDCCCEGGFVEFGFERKY